MQLTFNPASPTVSWYCSPEMGPEPYLRFQGAQRTLDVELDFGSYDASSRQLLLRQATARGTTRSEDPVSKVAVNLCGGVPTVISPVHCVFWMLVRSMISLCSSPSATTYLLGMAINKRTMKTNEYACLNVTDILLDSRHINNIFMAEKKSLQRVDELDGPAANLNRDI